MQLEDQPKGVFIATPNTGYQFLRAAHPNSGMCFQQIHCHLHLVFRIRSRPARISILQASAHLQYYWLFGVWYLNIKIHIRRIRHPSELSTSRLFGSQWQRPEIYLSSATPAQKGFRRKAKIEELNYGR